MSVIRILKSNSLHSVKGWKFDFPKFDFPEFPRNHTRSMHLKNLNCFGKLALNSKRNDALITSSIKCNKWLISVNTVILPKLFSPAFVIWKINNCPVSLLLLLQIKTCSKNLYFVTKIVRTYCEKKLFYWLRKSLEIRDWKPRLWILFWNY